MSQPSSSTSSSEPGPAAQAVPRIEPYGGAPEPGPGIDPEGGTQGAVPRFVRGGATVRGALGVLAWTLLFLMVIDVAVNLLFPFSPDPAAQRTGSLAAHFEYGRSIQGKLRWMFPPDGTIAPPARGGWLEPNNAREKPLTFEPGGDLRVTFYGMSFSNRVAQAVADLDPGVRIRRVAAPAAPPSHSFAAYQRERDQPADAVVFSILADQVRGMLGMTGASWGFELPNPYTYPRYYLKEGRLEPVWPEIMSAAQLRQAVEDPAQWARFTAQLEQHDDFYRAELFNADVWDRSSLFRLLRRAWARHQLSRVEAGIHTSSGFREASEVVVLLKAMVIEFAASARQDGKRPVVLLINTPGMKDHLYQTLKPTLEANQIPYVSSHEVAPPGDLRNFAADSHFSPEANQRVAERLLTLLRAGR